MKFEDGGLVHVTRAIDFLSACGDARMAEADIDMSVIYRKAATSADKPLTCMLCTVAPLEDGPF